MPKKRLASERRATQIGTDLGRVVTVDPCESGFVSNPQKVHGPPVILPTH
jgi:hypothetical protein